MADRFFRNQTPAERAKQLNSLAGCVDEVEERVEVLEQSGGGTGAPVYDPGDLTVYYGNGKA
jgi:hypothetical protein